MCGSPRATPRIRAGPATRDCRRCGCMGWPGGRQGMPLASTVRLHFAGVRGRLHGSSIGLAALLSCAACGGSGPAGYGLLPALSKSAEAQDGFRKLLRAFAQGTRADRIKLEAELQLFRTRFPTDGQARTAEALLGWIAMERGDLPGAVVIAKRVEAEGAGTTTDLARTIEGAVMR